MVSRSGGPVRPHASRAREFRPDQRWDRPKLRLHRLGRGLEQVCCQVRVRGFQISLMTLKVPAILEGAAEVHKH